MSLELPPSCLPPDEPDMGEVIAEVAKAWKVSTDDLLGYERTTRLNRARQAAVMAIIALCPTATIGEIARVFNRDHTTIIYYKRKAAKRPVGGAAT